MTLSDSLSPAGLDQSVRAPAERTTSADDRMATQINSLVASSLHAVHGSASEQARASIAEARASEGPDAFGRIATDPAAFAPVANAAYAPHLCEAYAYQEYAAELRGDALPDTHLLDALGPEARAEARTGREDLSTSGAAPEHGPDDPYVPLGPTRDALEIQRLLDPDAHPLSLDYGVTRRDMDAIGEVARAFPSVEHGSRVLSELDDAVLQRWADNLDDHALQGGLDAAERRTHYAELARNLDATQFNRFAEAVVRAGDAQSIGGGVDEARWFSYAAAETAPVETLVSFAEQATTRGLASKDASLAPAVAEALRGLGDRDPAALGRVLEPYTKEETQWLAAGAVYQQVAIIAAPDGTSVTTIDHDASSLGRVLYAVASAGDVDTKGLFFVAAAEQMETLRELPVMTGVGVTNTGAEDGAGRIRNGLSHVVHSDTTGVMTSVALEADTKGIVATVAYAEALLEAGQTDRVRVTLEKLLQGNGRKETPIERFGPERNATPSDAQRDNAAALGHFAGAVAGALENRSSDRAKQAEALSDVFAGVLTVAASAAGPASAGGRVAQGTASALAQPLAETIAAKLSRFSAGEAELDETLFDIAQPQVPNADSPKGGLRPHRGADVTNDFTTRFERVVNFNHRDLHK